jgi:hypothetical protein
MWSRGQSHPLFARSAAVGLAVLAVSGLGLSAAQAAPVTTVPLDAPKIEMSLWDAGNRGVLPLASPYPMQQTVTIPTVGLGGAVTFQLPPHVHPAGDFGVGLEMAPDESTLPTRTYSTSPADPADVLVLTDLGGGDYRVDIPADAAADGPLGFLAVWGLGIDGGSAVIPTSVWNLAFQLSATGPATLDVPMQLIGASGVPCLVECPVPSVPAGSRLDLVLPPGSALTTAGLADLSHSVVAMQPAQSDGVPLGPTYEGWTPSITQLPAVLSADARTVSVTMPVDTAPGSYSVTVAASDGTAEFLTFTNVHVDVVPADSAVTAAPATGTPALNPGLRSETGGDDGSSSLLPVALSALAVAGVAVRVRRRSSLTD